MEEQLIAIAVLGEPHKKSALRFRHPQTNEGYFLCLSLIFTLDADNRISWWSSLSHLDCKTLSTNTELSSEPHHVFAYLSEKEDSGILFGIFWIERYPSNSYKGARDSSRVMTGGRLSFGGCTDINGCVFNPGSSAHEGFAEQQVVVREGYLYVPWVGW